MANNLFAEKLGLSERKLGLSERKLGLFYRYYDLIFKQKNYSKETELIFKLSNKYGIKNPTKILEIGCGTGNHTEYLIKKNRKITALDIDKEMIKIAKEKFLNKDVIFLHEKVENLNEKNFDLVLAMFNVITYINTLNNLESFIYAVSLRLKKGGIFIFDCWNGIAAMKFPPKVKSSLIKLEEGILKITVTPQTDYLNQKTTLNYMLISKRKKEIKKDQYKLTQMLWTPKEIEYFLTKNGFKLEFISPLLNPDKKATEKDWKIMFCAKKIIQ